MQTLTLIAKVTKNAALVLDVLFDHPSDKADRS